MGLGISRKAMVGFEGLWTNHRFSGNVYLHGGIISMVLFIYKTHFLNHALKTRFLFSRSVFLRVVSRSVVCQKTRFLLNKKRIFKAWFQKCVL